MNRFLDAKYRVDCLMQVLEDAGFELEDPYSITSLVLPDYIHYAAGATRMVVWDDENPDYVIKIALDAKSEKYNEHEVELYKAAVRAGLAEHFAWCTEMYHNGEKGIYVMEYLDCDDEEIDSESYEWGFSRYCAENDLNPQEAGEEYEDAYWHSSEYEDLILDWFRDKLASSVVNKFDWFVDRYDINDIHSANMGRRNGQLVLCDYAGYGW